MRQTGTVKFFNASKGYGFITPDDGGKDVFVHVTAVERSGMGALTDGQRISFETEPDKRGKGPKAVELQIAASNTAAPRARRSKKGRREPAALLRFRLAADGLTVCRRPPIALRATAGGVVFHQRRA